MNEEDEENEAKGITFVEVKTKNRQQYQKQYQNKFASSKSNSNVRENCELLLSSSRIEVLSFKAY